MSPMKPIHAAFRALAAAIPDRDFDALVSAVTEQEKGHRRFVGSKYGPLKDAVALMVTRALFGADPTRPVGTFYQLRSDHILAATILGMQGNLAARDRIRAEYPGWEEWDYCTLIVRAA